MVKMGPEPKLQYDWSPGRSYSVSAQAVGEELHKIETSVGRIEPEELVERAKPAKSPLHPLFEWDNKKAAHSWRVHQARNVIGSITITKIGPVEPVKTRAFVNLSPAPDGRHYESIQVVLRDGSKRARLVKQARAEIQAWRRRYAELTEFVAVFDAIDTLPRDAAE